MTVHPPIDHERPIADDTMPRRGGDMLSGRMAATFFTTCLRTIDAHRVYLAVLVVYGLACLAVAAHYGAAQHLRLSLYQDTSLTVLLTFFVAFFIGHAVYWAVVRRPAEPLLAIVADLRQNYVTADRILPGLVVMLTMPSFISIFTTMKVLIPVIQPFAYDPLFAEIDRWLHFGVDPWRLLHPLFGTPAATTAINFLYHLWLFVVFFVLFWQAFSTADRRLRARFLVSFVLCWSLLGTLAATLMSSAGPVFYERVVGVDGGFAELVDYLHAAAEVSPVWALDVHEILWTNYASASIGLGAGISAMPSLHVSIVALLVPVCWRAHRVLGIAAILYVSAILIGSVHLAWHYAIDGYLAILLTWIIWRLSAWLVPADERR